MEQADRWRILILLLAILACFPHSLAATLPPDYTITYTITIQEGGTAAWQVEFRTLLVTQEDMNLFENSSPDLEGLLHSQFEDLMQESAVQASVATSRPMQIANFSSDSLVQVSPSGKYGVIRYSFLWTGFARSGDGLEIGDTFLGGMYLDKDTTLILRYPPGYTVSIAEPEPDRMGSDLLWYGPRSFGGGEPRVVLERSQTPWLPLLLAALLITLLGGGSLVFFTRKKRTKPGGTEEPAPLISEGEILSLEERILQLLTVHREGMFQSEIGKTLGIPKSTLSTTLNDLHRRGIIQKVKKGKENLIRLP
jgi:uncharacterized membrane protein